MTEDFEIDRKGRDLYLLLLRATEDREIERLVELYSDDIVKNALRRFARAFGDSVSL